VIRILLLNVRKVKKKDIERGWRIKVMKENKRK